MSPRPISIQCSLNKRRLQLLTNYYSQPVLNHISQLSILRYSRTSDSHIRQQSHIHVRDILNSKFMQYIPQNE